MRWTLRALAVAGTAAAAVAVVTAPASAAACQVTNGSAAFGSVQAAVDAASAGDRLVISGTCTGGTVVTKDLTLAGSATGPNRPVLSGGNTVRVLGIEPQATVTLTDVIIRSGNAAAGSGGGGIQNSGSLKAVRVLVTGNRTTGAGGGILNLGDLVLTRSLVSSNRTPSDGGGIFNAGSLVTWSTDLKGNTAGGVGGGMFAEGIATMHGGVGHRQHRRRHRRRHPDCERAHAGQHPRGGQHPGRLRLLTYCRPAVAPPVAGLHTWSAWIRPAPARCRSSRGAPSRRARPTRSPHGCRLIPTRP